MKNLVALLVLSFFWGESFALEVGDMAPDFALQGTDGETHRLADYRGKRAVALAWFPRAYTSGCTLECKSLAENGHLLRAYEVIYFMASVDPIEENIGFAKKEKADFPLLSDPTKKIAKAYGVLSEQGYALRQTFYISKAGKILAIDRNVRPAQSAQDMAAMFAKLKIPVLQE